MAGGAAGRAQAGGCKPPGVWGRSPLPWEAAGRRGTRWGLQFAPLWGAVMDVAAAAAERSLRSLRSKV
jgi:hypothetical protein